MSTELLTSETIKRCGRYNFKGQPERLIYLRKVDGWHQFKRIDCTREVWCELTDAGLHMLEETNERTRMNDLSLVERLRYSGLGASWGELCKEAANHIESQAAEIARITAERDALRADAERYRWLADHARSTSEHWGGRWSLVIDGPAPVRHDCVAALDAAIDAARAALNPKEQT